MSTSIAIDIGASSGRVIAGIIEDDKLVLKEVYRFANDFRLIDEHERWDIDSLVYEIQNGLKKSSSLGIKSASVGVDTWGVDYVLIGKDGKKLADPVAYRDKRTFNAVDKFLDYSKVSKMDIYSKTGIAFNEFNTLFQLFVENKELLKKTDSILLIPDYINYVLTGKKVLERTNASTMQLLNPFTSDLDSTLLQLLNIKRDQFPQLKEPGTFLGKMLSDPSYDVISIASHDTASAVIGTIGKTLRDTSDKSASRETENWAFLSSGTWSLLGAELDKPILTTLALENKFTNEQGAMKTFRFLKNIMGLWIIQRIQKEFEQNYSFSKLQELASLEKPFQQRIDINDSRLINPKCMISEIQNMCKETNQPIPKTAGEIVQTVYSNLALSYSEVLKIIERSTNKPIKTINIVGGGSNINLLNQMTSNCMKIEVKTGPVEATAIGNIMMQFIAKGEIENIDSARKMINRSFPISTFTPQN
jgi:rhamnulokinase